MHHPPKTIINIKPATKRWVQPRWGLQESLETTRVLSTDRSWMTLQCLIFNIILFLIWFVFVRSLKKDDRRTTIWYWSLNWQTDLFVQTEGTTLIGLFCFTNPSCRLKSCFFQIDRLAEECVREKLACRLAQNPWLSPRPVQLLLKRMNKFVIMLSFLPLVYMDKKLIETRQNILCVTRQMSRKKRKDPVGSTVRYEMMN